MATTTNYSWATPDDTDLVKDGAAAIRTLGSSADTTVGNLNPGTTAGDIDYYTSGTAKARVGIGTAGQILVVNAGATAPEWASPAGGGKVLQVVQATSTTATTVTSTTVYGDLGLSVSITPSSATSKVLIMVSQSIYSTRASAGSVGYAVQIVRDSTPVFTPAVANYGSGYISYSGGSGNWGINNMLNMNYLDSPNTTSAITYKTQGYTQSSVVGQFNSAGSTIIAMEIAA